MWLLFAVLLVFASHADCGALRCAEGNSCTEQELKAPLGKLIRDESVKLSREAECQPGTEWESNCHSCKCSDVGLAVCVRQETCEKAVYAEPIRCKPNTTFQRDCNTCNCGNGQAFCTLKGCLHGDFHFVSKRAVELPSGRECAIGSTWKSQCNTCFCSQSGTAACTRAECVGHSPEPRRSCAPQTSWIDDCNTCWCDNGEAVCTLKGCIGYKTKRSVDLPSGRECAIGSTWTSECNTCFCTQSGTASCTRVECGEYTPEKKRSCAPKTSWIDDCNTCWCEDGIAMCTLMECYGFKNPFPFKVDNGKVDVAKPVTQTAVSRLKRASQETAKQCQPGKEFRLDCNKCLCDNVGKNFSCTRIDCNALNNNHNADAFSSARTKRDATVQEVAVKCVPGSVFHRGCNVCRCSDEDHAVCTIHRCQHDNELDSRATEQDLGFRCNPGEQFANECNDCTCSADGRSVFCTLRLCDKAISPDI